MSTDELPQTDGSEPTPPRDAILEALLEELDNGRELDVDELCRRFGASEQTAAAFVGVISRFTALRQALRAGERLPRLTPGTRLGDFEVRSFLQRGAVGEVYRAAQTSLSGRDVALKVMSLQGLAPGDDERLVREAHLASLVHHPNLVEVYASGREPELGLFYYAMRLVEGPTLRSVLEDRSLIGPASADVGRKIVRRIAEVASALAALHERGLVHRDVKPSNILLEGWGPDPLGEQSAVLVDYGLLRPYDPATRSSLHLTLAYAAPEQLLGRACDPRADVFALGVVLHDLLAGRLPESRSPAAEGLDALGALGSGADHDLDAIVRKATEAERDWRYSDAGHLAEDLRAWLEGRPVLARPPGIARRAFAWFHSNPARMLRLVGRGTSGLLVAGLVVLLVSTLANLVRSARRVEAAWSAGNLEDLAGALQQVPRLADHILSAEPAFLVRELRSEEPASPLSIVVSLAGRDRLAAARLAAAYVERDGLTASGVLGRFLLHELNESPATVLPIVARLFMERPDETSMDTSASSAIKESLLQILHEPPNEITAQYCVTALSGCATAADAIRLAEWARERALRRGPEATEDVRLVHASLQEVLFWRGRGLPFLRDMGSEDLDCVLECCSESLVALGSAPLPDSVTIVTTGLFICTELARRRMGLHPGTLGPPQPVPASLRLLAARRDPDFREELQRPGLLESMGSLSLPGRYLEFGLLVGAFEDAQLSRSLQKRVQEHARVSGVDEREASMSYQLGLKRVAAWLRGSAADHLPDEDTHLATEIAVYTTPTASCSFESLHPPPGVVVIMAFDSLAPRVTGQGLTMETRGMRLLPAEDDPQQGFARLGLFGSSLKLHFDCPEGVAMDSIHLDIQKGNRALLPHYGSANIDVLLDGEPRIQEMAVQSGVRETVAIPLRRERERATRGHTIELRVCPTSSTTLRVYSLRVDAWSGPPR